MALGTITVNKKAQKAASSPTRIFDLTVVGDASYPTGGTAGLTALLQAHTGIREAITIIGIMDIGGITTHYPVYDAINDKLMVFVRTTGAQVANAADLSGVSFRMAVLAQ